MVFFAQIVVKQWSWVLKQGDWLEMISIYLTLVWFEVLYKDRDSRNNEIFQPVEFGQVTLPLIESIKQW